MIGWNNKDQTILDDRGERVNLPSVSEAIETGAITTWREYLWSILIILSIAIALGVFVLEPDLSKLGRFGEIAGWIIGGLAIACVIWMRTYYKVSTRRDWQSDESLRRGHCAQCGRALAGLTPQPDNCIQCPECGAAWKADRVGKPPRP